MSKTDKPFAAPTKEQQIEFTRHGIRRIRHFLRSGLPAKEVPDRILDEEDPDGPDGIMRSAARQYLSSLTDQVCGVIVIPRDSWEREDTDEIRRLIREEVARAPEPQ